MSWTTRTLTLTAAAALTLGLGAALALAQHGGHGTTPAPFDESGASSIRTLNDSEESVSSSRPRRLSERVTRAQILQLLMM